MLPPMSKGREPTATPPDRPEPGSTADAPPSAATDTDEQPAQPHGAMQTLADMAMLPVQEALHGHDWWLRTAMLAQLCAVVAVTLVAFREGIGDWQAYLALGACVAILVGNFMRWRRKAGWLRRILGTALALAVDLGWALLLWDRARSPSWEDTFGRAVPEPAWFWLPLGLLLASAVLLIAHLVAAPRHKTIA
jgi:hypothetical protein